MTATLTAPVTEDRTSIAGSPPPAAPVVYLNGELVPKTDARLSIYDHGFLYGDGAFEGIRVYRNNIFRLEPHLARLLRSCKAMHIDLGMSLDDLREAVVSVVRANKMESGYIRLSISRGVGLGLDPSHLKSAPTIVISTEQLRLYPQELYERGLDVITASTRVPPAVCIDPQVKSLGRYVNNINAKMEANRVGAGEALMLNMQGNVAEATGDNIFLVKDGELTTPPTSEGALPGITRQAVMDLAKDLGITCRQSVMTLYDVVNADEAFLTGTAAEVIPMISCDGRAIGSGRPGKVTGRIIAAFRELTLTDGVRVEAQGSH
jgi:branched-chain amino acid aminotransferase